MPESMIFVAASDGIQLEGLLVQPETMTGLAPVIWLHGLHLKFCEPEYVALARAIAARGRPVILANTRGQSFGAWLRGAPTAVLGGSGWELFQECVLDIDAWIAAAAEHLGATDVVLGGHGYGGTKAVYHMARRRDARVCALIAASSGTLVRDRLDESELKLAEAMIAEGRGADLMPFGTLRGSIAGTVSAQVFANRVQIYRDLYGSGAMPPILARIEAPLFAFFGALEQTPARDVASFLESIARNAVRSRQVETAMIPGAGYFFTGREPQVAERIDTFLASLLQQQVPSRRRRAGRG